MGHLDVNRWGRILFSIGLGLVLTLSWVSSMVLAEALDQPTLSEPPNSDPNTSPILPLTYARAVTHNVLVYNTSDITPVRSLGAGYVWVSLANSQPITQNEQAWYAINQDEYVRADQLSLFTPSTFQGITLAGTPAHPFAWMVFDMWPSPAPGLTAAGDAPLFKRYNLISIYEEQVVGDRIWYRVGPDQWLEQGNVGIVAPSSRPEGVGAADKWIEINLYEQTLAAYEGDQLVYATLVSSGLPQWQTPQGLFQIQLKVKQAKMSGRDGYSDYYFLEDVPWSMYFYGGYALHGAYWHDKFGLKHSHGCVNLPPEAAKWLFDWATPATKSGNFTLATAEMPGTWVWLHD